MRLRDGRKWISPSVIVQLDDNAGPGVRIGITATKKLGGAVVRNRVKRRLRAAARLALGAIQTPVDIVLIGREATASCPFATLLKDLRWCLRRLEVTGHDSTDRHHAA